MQSHIKMEVIFQVIILITQMDRGYFQVPFCSYDRVQKVQVVVLISFFLSFFICLNIEWQCKHQYVRERKKKTTNFCGKAVLDQCKCIFYPYPNLNFTPTQCGQSSTEVMVALYRYSLQTIQLIYKSVYCPCVFICIQYI